MEVLNIYKCSIQPIDKLEKLVEVIALIDFNDGRGAIDCFTNFQYIPTEWPDDKPITTHIGKPQSTLISWLECLCSDSTDWHALDDLYL